jgi:hypothetical protein
VAAIQGALARVKGNLSSGVRIGDAKSGICRRLGSARLWQCSCHHGEVTRALGMAGWCVCAAVVRDRLGSLARKVTGRGQGESPLAICVTVFPPFDFGSAVTEERRAGG